MTWHRPGCVWRDVLPYARLSTCGGQVRTMPVFPRVFLALTSALIAWNGSFEAANAVRSAIGLLKIASEVQVLQIEEDKDPAFPSTRVLEYLSRHGIHAELKVERAHPGTGDIDFAFACLNSKAKQANASYIVMGGYGHSRVSEYVFGGVTRSMLSGSAVPLFMAR